MKRIISLLCFVVLFSCNGVEKNSVDENALDFRNSQQLVHKLCDLFQELNNPNITEETYRTTQAKIEFLYSFLEYGEQMGYFTDDELLNFANDIDCII